MKSLSRILILIVMLCILFSFSVTAQGEDIAYGSDATAVGAPVTSAAAMALYDPVEKNFLATANGSERRPMASTTKIMTALVVLKTLSPDETVTVPKEAVGIEGSSVYLYAGERITVENLLYALLLSSANDAAAALALHACGSIPAFAEEMNREAERLGLTNTHFMNPHGLPDPEHYTTACDLARIAAAAMENQRFCEIVATKRHVAKQDGTDATRLFLNHNRLLHLYPGTVGIKTGFTRQSGRCLVSAAQRDGLTLIAVTLQDGNDWRDHASLYDWAFENYECFCPSIPSVSLPVVGGTAQTVTLVPDGTLLRTLQKGHGEITCTLEAPRFLYAGFEAGKTVGRLVYRADGKELGSVILKTSCEVTKQKRPSFFSRIKALFGARE